MNVNRDPEVRVCAVCGKRFATRSATAKYCSDGCRARAPWKRAGRSRPGKRKVDSFLAAQGAAHDEINAMRAELAALRY